jgi:hypothetical protein
MMRLSGGSGQFRLTPHNPRIGGVPAVERLGLSVRYRPIALEDDLRTIPGMAILTPTCGDSTPTCPSGIPLAHYCPWNTPKRRK